MNLGVLAALRCSRLAQWRDRRVLAQSHARLLRRTWRDTGWSRHGTAGELFDPQQHRKTFNMRTSLGAEFPASPSEEWSAPASPFQNFILVIAIVQNPLGRALVQLLMR